MSLSKEPVFSQLRNRFVCGYRDISSEPYAGNSGTHKTDGAAVETTNGAGPHNVQLFILNPDGTVLHCLPGYWNPEDLSGELALAERLNSLYMDKSVTPQQKAGQFKRLQLDHVRSHSPQMVARSQLQGFDKQHEAKRSGSDAIKSGAVIADDSHHLPDDMFKTTDELMHERMSKRPFVAYSHFDVARFSDYGSHFYDKHEDNLDEQGRMIDPDVKAVPLKGGHHKRAVGATYGRPARGHVPRMQVKNYGTVRPQHRWREEQ